MLKEIDERLLEFRATGSLAMQKLREETSTANDELRAELGHVLGQMDLPVDAALRKTHRNVEELLDEKEMVTRRKLVHFCFLKRFSEVRKLTTFYLAKNDHRWVTFISLKTINTIWLAEQSKCSQRLPTIRRNTGGNPASPAGSIAYLSQLNEICLFVHSNV